MSQKLQAFCIICTKKFKCDPREFDKPICSKCKKLTPKEAAQLTSPKIKNEKRGFDVRAEITTDGAIMNALMANASAFRATGGSPMMFTEHVENGIDAIKILHKWKSTDSPKKLGDIRIIFDDSESQIVITDNGTGIEDPIWILNNPLRSRKTSVSIEQTGKYGRGLQGFRGFCENLDYFTLRDLPHESEIKHPKNQGFTTNQIKCSTLQLRSDSVYGHIVPDQLEKFKKYTNSQTGTVAIFTNWIEDEYDNLKRKKKDLYERIQHHFRHDLEIGLIKITIEDGRKIKTVAPREFANENGPFDPYELPKHIVYDDITKKEIGTIEYFLYKSSGEYKPNYKQPFLLAKDNRPLQDSFISTMPQMSQYPVWKSSYVTGFIKCNFVEPDNLRVALSVEGDNKRKNTLFFNALRADSITLKKLVSEWQSTFIKTEQIVENRNIILEIQSFLKNQKVKLDLPDLTQLGFLEEGKDGSLEKGDRISEKSGKDNQGKITKIGTEEVVIFYEKGTKGPGPGGKRKNRKKRLRVTLPTKDGRNTTTMLMDPSLLSKDGRRRKQKPKGIDLQPADEELNTDMSWYDPNTLTIYVNEGHKIFLKMIELKRKSQTEKTSFYSKKQKNFIRRCYLWELITNFYKKDEEGLSMYDEFWELFHKFFLHKDSD